MQESGGQGRTLLLGQLGGFRDNLFEFHIWYCKPTWPPIPSSSFPGRFVILASRPFLTIGALAPWPLVTASRFSVHSALLSSPTPGAHRRFLPQIPRTPAIRLKPPRRLPQRNPPAGAKARSTWLAAGPLMRRLPGDSTPGGNQRTFARRPPVSASRFKQPDDVEQKRTKVWVGLTPFFDGFPSDFGLRVSGTQEGSCPDPVGPAAVLERGAREYKCQQDTEGNDGTERPESERRATHKEPQRQVQL